MTLPADVAAGRRWTYRELAADVNALALGFLDRGVAKGERVGIWAPNCAEWIMVQYATAKIGAILVNINPAYGSRELEYVLRQSGIRTLVAAPKFRTSDYAGKTPTGTCIVAEFPMTVTGKVRKVEMRERSIELLGLPKDVPGARHA